jgi:hypothetical protein
MVNATYWPKWSDGGVVQPHDLPLAFTLLLTRPQCPCTMQETNPEISHDYDIWVVQSGRFAGKVAAACA